MDRKTLTILNFGKYGGFIAVLWIAINNAGFDLSGSIIPFVFIFAIDNVRTYYLDSKLPALSVPTLYIQALLSLVFIFLDGSTLGGILLIILIAESMISYSYSSGENIFLLSLVGFPVISALALVRSSELNWENMAASIVNMLFFFFAYAVTKMARRQMDERERAENALEQLDRSKRDLELAYNKLVEISKEKEQLAAVEERSRLARELHDTLAHSLTAIIVSLEAGKRIVTKNPGKALEEITKSQEQARKGLDEVRITVKALRSDSFKDVDFAAAIKNLARDYGGSGIEITYHADRGIALDQEYETVFYRIIQESITNSIRHGSATVIDIYMRRVKGQLLLEVVDNGPGCEKLVEGFGMQGIRERAASIGGEVTFGNLERGGFKVSISLKENSQ
jgi:signal transduction histidine kinase